MDEVIHGTNNDNNNGTANLIKYREIMKKYQNGEYGSEYLSLYEILLRAGEPNLLRQMSSEELDELMNNSFGMERALFISIKNALFNQEENRDCSLKRNMK